MKVVVAALLLASSTAWAQGRAGSSSPGAVAFNDGVKAYNEDEYNTAEQKFTEAIQLDPSLTDAWWRLASIHYRTKQYKKAVELLRRCPDKNNVEVKQQLGLALYKTATPAPAEAVRLLEDAVTQRPDMFIAQGQLGQHFQRSDPKRAAAAFELYFKHRPAEAAKADEGVHLNLGLTYIYGKDWDGALREFELLSKQKQNDEYIRLLLGAALTGKGDLKSCSQAIALFERSLSLATTQPSIYYNLGSCYLKVSRGADAEREAALYTKARPTDTKGFVLLGDAQFTQRRYDKALTSFQAARALDRTSLPILTKVGLTDVELGNFDAAMTELEQAEQTHQNDAEILCALTRVYGKKGLRDKLLLKADRLAAMRAPSAQLCAGQAYFVQGNDDKAAAAFNEVLVAEPTNLVAKGALVKVLNRRASAALDKSDAPKAQQLLSEAQHLSPDDLMTNRNLALTLILAKRYPEALEVLARVVKKLGKPDLVINRLMGRAYLGLGKRKEAQAELEKSAAIGLKLRGVDLAGVYTELGPLYVDSGNLDQAVTVLEQAVKEGAGTPAVLIPAQRNLVLAYMARAVERLRDAKSGEGALDDTARATALGKGVLQPKELLVVTCYHGVAALKAGRFQEANDAFKHAAQSGGCPLKAQWEKLGTGFLSAYAGYRDAAAPRSREEAARFFSSQIGKTTGATAELLRSLLRSTYELLAFDYFAKSDEKRAESNLRSAAKVVAKGERRELEHNLAVTDLFFGRLGAAEKVLDGLAGRPPESLLNLGIIKDRQGDGRAALQMYKRAWERGVRLPKLKEWIDVKERLWGAGGNG